MSHKCTVPTGSTIDVPDNFHYIFCGKDAKYKCERWYLCEGHKTYLADISKWSTELIEGDE